MKLFNSDNTALTFHININEVCKQFEFAFMMNVFANNNKYAKKVAIFKTQNEIDKEIKALLFEF